MVVMFLVVLSFCDDKYNFAIVRSVFADQKKALPAISQKI